MNQIEKDLTRHAQDRLQRWINDTRSVFNMADLGDARAAGCIIIALTEALAQMMMIANLSNEDMDRLLDRMATREKKRAKQ